MTSTEFDSPELDDEPRRSLLRQVAITAVMLWIGLMIALDVLRRRRQHRMTNP